MFKFVCEDESASVCEGPGGGAPRGGAACLTGAAGAAATTSFIGVVESQLFNRLSLVCWCDDEIVGPPPFGLGSVGAPSTLLDRPQTDIDAVAADLSSSSSSCTPENVLPLSLG